MTHLTTLLHDGLPSHEIAHSHSVLSAHEWTHTMTLGVAGDYVTYGDVWMSVTKGCQTLVRLDPSAQYALWICKNIQSDRREGRPHAHGVIRTSLKQYQIDSCFYTYGEKSYKAKPITDINTVEGWFGYFLPQAVHDTHITNISQEIFA